jgi:hypothetical protein
MKHFTLKYKLKTALLSLVESLLYKKPSEAPMYKIGTIIDIQFTPMIIVDQFSYKGTWMYGLVYDGMQDKPMNAVMVMSQGEISRIRMDLQKGGTGWILINDQA